MNYPPPSLLSATSDAHVIFRSVSLPACHTAHRVPVDHTSVILALEGMAQLSWDGQPPVEICGGRMLFLPCDIECMSVIRSDARFLLWIFTRDTTFEMRDCLCSLREHVCDNSRRDILQMDMPHQVTDYLRLLWGWVDEAPLSARFQSVAAEHLMMLMMRYCDPSMLAAFMSPLLVDNLDFKSRVLDLCEDVQTVEDLADQCNMSMDTFLRRFKETFGSTPKKWLIRRLARIVYREVYMSKLTFSEIAARHNMSSSAYLTYFCKKNFGLTPHEIRGGVSKS